MPFTPVSLPIQQILMTNFITDIATISNANVLLLQAKLEDLINDLEIDIAGLSIGTDNAITSIKSQFVIIQDQALIYQTGTPTPTTIASLTKNISNESIFQVDKLITNLDASIGVISVNTLTVATAATFNGTSSFTAPTTFTSAVVESKETITYDLLWDGISPAAEATLILSKTTKQNIFLTLKASTAPNPNPVYDGISVDSGINEFIVNLDFDITNPPAQNTVFTIYLVDIINSISFNSIISPAVQAAAIPIKFVGGTNLSTTNSIITHDGAQNVGLPTSATLSQYGTSVTFNYIIDANNDDRLIVKGLIGTSLF